MRFNFPQFGFSTFLHSLYSFNFAFYFFLLFSLYGCREAKPLEVRHENLLFFSIRNLLQTEIDLLQKTKIGVHKIADYDGVQEEKNFAQPDWKKELTPFIEVDVNKIAWAQEFVTTFDTLTTSNKTVLLEIISQTPYNRKIPVKEIKIIRNKQKVIEQITVQIHVINLLYENTKNMQLIFSNGRLENYRISGTQQLFTGSTKTYTLECQIERKELQL